MQSSMAVAGMDALSYPSENILTRRANQWHSSIIAQLAKRPWPCPTTGFSRVIAGKKSLPTIEVALARRSCWARRSCIGSTQRRVASRVAEPRALSDARARGDLDVNTVPDLDKATALEVAANKFAGVLERVPARLKMGIPHRPGVDHVRPDLECNCDIGRACGGGKARGIREQCFAGADLNQRRRKIPEVSIERGDPRIFPVHIGWKIGLDQFGQIRRVHDRIDCVLGGESSAGQC